MSDGRELSYHDRPTTTPSNIEVSAGTTSDYGYATGFYAPNYPA